LSVLKNAVCVVLGQFCRLDGINRAGCAAAALALTFASNAGYAQAMRPYLLGAGDVLKVTVFQNPDLSTEARVSEGGEITFPLVGSIVVGGLTTAQGEQKIASALRSGNFVLRPQVNMTVLQFRSRMVSVLGSVNRPGRYPLEDQSLRLADVLSLAGGVSQLGGDVVIVSRPAKSASKEERMTIDLDAAFVLNDLEKNIELQAGDTVYVPRYPVFYVYGQVNRPGQYRIERNMTLQQAIAVGGGPTLRGTEKGIQIRRRDAGGKVDNISPGLADRVMHDDVIYVRESVF